MHKSSKYSKQKPHVVVIGGGTGAFTVLSGLRKYPVRLSAVVSMADDGGSTGMLREEFGILPPGDVRRVLIAMSHSDDRMLADLFNYRFEEGGLKGHSFGNIMLTALERITGNFEGAIEEASRMLGVEGQVFPVTLKNVRLCAKFENGKIVRGETNIDIPQDGGGEKISRVWLDPEARINTNACAALLSADMIVLGPGDLYTSVIPNLLVRGVREAIKKSRAKKVYVANIMTKRGETDGFRAADFVATLERYLGKGMLHYVLVNTKRPSGERLRLYEQESAEFVDPNNLPSRPTPILGDFLRRKGFVRHDPERLAQTIVSLL